MPLLLMCHIQWHWVDRTVVYFVYKLMFISSKEKTKFVELCFDGFVDDSFVDKDKSLGLFYIHCHYNSSLLTHINFFFPSIHFCFLHIDYIIIDGFIKTISRKCLCYCHCWCCNVCLKDVHFFLLLYLS